MTRKIKLELIPPLKRGLRGLNMIATIKEYTKLDKSILNLITVEFFVQLINVSFISILPLYMKAEGYSDVQYAHFTSYRYFGMLALAFLQYLALQFQLTFL